MAPATGGPAVLRNRVLTAAALALVAAGLFLCYLTVSGKVPVTSDGAGNALQAWSMLHGNWLLRGWWLSDVSFYTTELPEYMLVETVRGLSPAVVHTSAALTYTLLVIGAAWLAKGRAAGRAGSPGCCWPAASCWRRRRPRCACSCSPPTTSAPPYRCLPCCCCWTGRRLLVGTRAHRDQC